MKNWEYRPFAAAEVDRIQSEHGISRLLAVLLVQRGISDPEQAGRFLEPSLSHLHDPGLMLGMRKAVERLRGAIANQERILIYGDYDVDGTTSVVIVRKAIELAGGEADYHVPHRVKEGYGMREDVIEQASRDHVRLLISVDTGIRESAVVDRANELGIDCIITDHHLPEAAVPKALAVLNPNQPGCGYPDKNLCGVGVAFKLAHALLAGLEWPPAKLGRVLESMLKIVAIGTIADVVPLLGENRVFSKIGLAGLREPRNIGLQALLGVAGFSRAKLPSAGDVAFRVAPRINAAGRMDTAGEVVELFTTPDAARATAIAEKLNGLNSDRQGAEQEIVREILERLREIPPPSETPFIVEAGEGWHAGVIGIVASRIVERYHRPTLVLSCNADAGLATGSARGIRAFHLLEAMESTAELFVRFGGHRQAAGCTLAIDQIDELRRRLNAHAGSVLQPDDFVPTLELDAELPFRSIHDETMAELAQLAPHGLANPSPRFSTPNVRLVADPRILKEKHLKMRVEDERMSFDAIGWRMAERANGLRRDTRLDAAYTIEADTYNGGWQLVLQDFREARGAQAATNAGG